MRKILLSVSVFLAALGFAAPVLIQGFTGSEDATEVQLTEGEEGEEPVATDALAAAKTNATKLVEYLGAVNGLFEADDVTDATAAIDDATDEDGVKEAKNTFLAKVKPVNVSIKSFVVVNEDVPTPEPGDGTTTKPFEGQYLCNHAELLDDNTFGTSEPHAHGTFGFASVWQLAWPEDATGFEITSYFEGTEGESIASDGSSFGQGQWDVVYAELTGDNGSDISGIAFQNAAGQYLGSNPDGTQSGTEITITSSSLWTIERVYVPVSVSFSSESETVVGATSVNIKPVLVSDGGNDDEGNPIPVTPGLDGMTWTSADEDIASVEGVNLIESMVPWDAEEARNGYVDGKVIGQKVGETTITATSVMPASQRPADVEESALSASIEIEVTEGDESLSELTAAKENLKGLIEALSNGGVLTISGAELTDFENSINGVDAYLNEGDQNTADNANQALLPKVKELMGYINSEATFTISNTIDGATVYFTATLNGEISGQGYASDTRKTGNIRSIWTIIPQQNNGEYTGKVFVNCFGESRVLGQALAGTQLITAGAAAPITLNFQTKTFSEDKTLSGVTFYTTQSGNGFMCTPDNPNLDDLVFANKTYKAGSLNEGCFWTLEKAVVPTEVTLNVTVDGDHVKVNPVFTPVDATSFLTKLTYSYTKEGETDATEVTLDENGAFEAPTENGTYTLTATSPTNQNNTPAEGSNIPTAIGTPLSATAEFVIAEPLSAFTAEFAQGAETSFEEGTAASVDVVLTATEPEGYTILPTGLAVTIASSTEGAETPATQPVIAIKNEATGEYTITLPENLTPDTYKLTIIYNESSDESKAVTATGDLTITITKVALKSIAAELSETKLTYSAEAQELTVTITPDPTTYDLSAGTLTAAIAAAQTSEEGPETQADNDTEIILAKADDGTWSGTYTVAAGTAAGDYTITFTYTEGTGDDAVSKTATADLTIEKVKYAVTFNPDKLALTTASVATEVTVTVAQPAAEGEEATTYTGTWIATLSKKGENDEYTTIDNGNLTPADDKVTIPAALEAGSYKLTIAPAAADKDNVEFTGAELAFTVTKADAPVYTAVVKEGETEVTSPIEMTTADTKTLTVSFTKDGEAATDAPADWTASLKPATGDATTLTPTDGDIELSGLAAGTYTLSIVSESTDYSITDNSITVTVTAAPVESKISEITTTADQTIEKDTDDHTAVFTITTTGTEAPTADDLTLSIDPESTVIAQKGDMVIAAVDGKDNEFTATVTFTTVDAGKATITLADKATANDEENVISASVQITVTETPATEPGEISGISELSATKVAIADGKTSGTATISGKVTLDPEDGAVPTDAALTLAAATTAEGVESVEISDVKIAADGTFTATATVTLADGTTIPEEGIEATVTVTPSVDGSELTPATVTITISNATEGSSEDLEVKQPEESEIPAGAVVEVNAESKTAEVGFNASPAEGEAVASIKLPTADEAVTFENPEEMFTIDYSAEGVATATIDEKGNVTISLTDGAAIGSATVISIYAAEPKADAPATQTAIMLADETDEPGEADETEDAPAAILTINVTVYGVEFTTAPASATLGANGSVEVTFATNAKVPGAAADSEETEEGSEADNAAEVTLECEGAEVNGNVITFSEAGTYTVTAKAGDNYVATTTITVKNAPTVTGIEAVNADAAAGTAAIYDLQGRRLTRVNAAGIYIVNGVKTLIR